jgi:hypothetical protein
MANFELTPDETALFSQLSGVLDIQIAPSELPPVPLDGRHVFVDFVTGERFREQVRQTYAHVAYDLQDLTGSNAELEKRRPEWVTQVLSEQMRAPDAVIAPDDHMMVSGSGVILVADEARTNKTRADILNGSRNLFGKVAGIGFGQYAYATPEAIRQFSRNDEGLDHVLKKGTLLFLADAVLCDAGGYGQVQKRYGKVATPIIESEMILHKVYGL